jgi:hypothetical protein
MNSINKHFQTLVAPAFVASVFAVVLTAAFAGASAAHTNFLGGVHFDAGLPQGEWKDKIGTDHSLGGSAQIFYSPDSSPMAVGLDFGWSNYGSQSRQEAFGPHIPDVTVNVKTWNNFVEGFFTLRGQVPRGPLQLYGDALIGFNYLYTETTVGDSDGWDGIASTVNQDDTAFAYGLGAGVMAPLWQRKAESKGIEQVSIDAGARYVWGGRAEYLKEGALQHDNGQVSYVTTASRTNLAQLRLGVTARF